MSAASDVAGQISGAATNAVSSITGANAKIKDLERDIVDVSSSKQTMTADYGAPMSNTDAWLKVVDPTNPNGHGPQLLEDQFGREKVSNSDPTATPLVVILLLTTSSRFTVSIMREC